MKEMQNFYFTENDMKGMGKRIQNLRKSKGIKAIDFADIIGVGKDQLSRIENGKVVCKTEYLFTIARQLEITTDYLLYGDDFNKEKTAYAIMDLSPEMQDKILKIIEILK